MAAGGRCDDGTDRTRYGLAQIAAHRGTSVGTVRSQLKIAFEKTGTRRQAELAVLVRSFL